MRNKRITLLKWIGSIIAISLLVMLSACFSPYKGGSEGIVTINLGGNSLNSSRNAMTWPPDDPDNFILDKIDYVITLTGNGQPIQLTAKGSDNITTTVSVGWWNVNVKAYYPDKETLYAEGSSDLDVKAGINNSVSIQVKKAFDSFAVTFTVTFNSMGGSPVDPIRNVLTDTTINPPVPPTKSGYESKFVGWFDETLSTEWIFESNFVTDDITLYAKWEAYVIGDTGPGSGIIFHVDPSGFPLEGQGYTAYYLEAAPADIDGVYHIFPNHSSNISGLSDQMGTGMSNTKIIMESTDNDPESSAYVAYNYGYDWFLPSKDEIEEMCNYENIHGNDNEKKLGLDTGTFYQTSSDGTGNEYRWYLSFFNNIGSWRVVDNQRDHTPYSVRPIRAF